MNNQLIGPFRRFHGIILAALVVAWSISLVAWPYAPAQVPTHWNMYGEVDGYMSRFPGLFIFPIILTLLAGLFLVLPHIDPFRRNYASFTDSYSLMQLMIVVILTALHIITTLAAIGWNISVATLIPVIIGVLFVGIGNIMGKIRPNWFMGVRTPWTLSSPDVWTATHRVAGRLMVGVGIMMIVFPLLLPPVVAGPIVFAGVMVMAFGSIGYSYWSWRHLHQSDENGHA